jgi:hypothetical protein
MTNISAYNASIAFDASWEPGDDVEDGDDIGVVVSDGGIEQRVAKNDMA